MVHHANLAIPYPFEIRLYTRTQENSNNEFIHVNTCQYIQDFDFENYAHTLDLFISNFYLFLTDTHIYIFQHYCDICMRLNILICRFMFTILDIECKLLLFGIAFKLVFGILSVQVICVLSVR
jgi:hypothetical protein